MTQLEQVITLALDLPSIEQAKLIEQITSHLASQFSQGISLHQPEEHWGKKVIAFLETLDGDEWADIDDPIEWVKSQRRESERELDWGMTNIPNPICHIRYKNYANTSLNSPTPP